MTESKILKNRKELLRWASSFLSCYRRLLCGINREMFTVWGAEIKKSGQVGVISGGEAHPADQTKINMPPAHLIDSQPLMTGTNPISINKPIKVGQTTDNMLENKIKTELI